MAHGRSRRVPATPQRGGEPDVPAPERAPDRLLELQREVGNRAVSGLVQRQTSTPLPFGTPPVVGPPGGGVNPFGFGVSIPKEAREAIVRFLQAHRKEIAARVGTGKISEPQLIAWIHTSVAESRDLTIAQVDQVARTTLDDETPPQRRTSHDTAGRPPSWRRGCRTRSPGEARR
jgi:hypothetical protein